MLASRRDAADHALDVESDLRRGRRMYAAAGAATVGEWAVVWQRTLDLDARTAENYVNYIARHIEPRWGELAGLKRERVDVRRGTITIDSDNGCLHESKASLWLGPPKTKASARTVTTPPFLTRLLRDYLATTDGEMVFTSPNGFLLTGLEPVTPTLPAWVGIRR